MKWRVAVCGVVLAAFAAQAGAQTAEDLVNTIARGRGLSRSRARQMVQHLGRYGDEAVPHIAAAFKRSRVQPRAKLQLVQALGNIRTPESRKLLEHVLGHTRLHAAEVNDWKALGRALILGAGDNPPPANAHLWSMLEPPAKGLAQQAAAGEELEEHEKRYLARHLGELQSRHDFYNADAFVQLRPPEEISLLLKRYRPVKPEESPVGLSQMEMDSFNREWLELILGDAIQDRPVYKSAFNSDIRSAALVALAGFGDRRAREIVSGYEYADMRSRIEALAKLGGSACYEALARMMLSNQRRTSDEAAKALAKAAERHDTDVRNALESVWRKMSSKRQPRHVPTNYFEVAAKLPSYDAARLIADGLLARPFTIWQGALRAIAAKPSLLNNREVQVALNRRAETHIDSEFVSVVLLALRRNTRQRGVDQNLFGLELAARYLNHENSRVRRDAAQTMARLSGKRLGNNPAVWKKWWDEQSR